MRRRRAAVGLAVLSGVGLFAAVAWTAAKGVSSGEALTQFLLGFLLVALGTLLTGATGAWLAAWTGTWGWVVSLGAVVTLGMLWFPTGGVPSLRWRWVERAVLAAFGSAATTGALVSFQATGSGKGPNPLVWQPAEELLLAVHEGSLLVLALLAVLCSASLVLRYRRSRGLERAQLQWVAWAAVLAVTGYLTGDLTTRIPVITVTVMLAAVYAGAHLRDEVDLGALTGARNATVSATVVPRSVSLWLREVQP